MSVKKIIARLNKRLLQNHSQNIVIIEGAYTKEELEHNQILQNESDFLEELIDEIKIMSKKPTYKQLADYLGVTEQAVKQYPKIKRDLMIQGLWRLKESSSL